MIMPPFIRKLALTTHVICSVGWMGSAFAFLALAAASLASRHTQTVSAADWAMELTGWFVIVPLSIASLLSGLIQSLGSSWGLFRHYWILAKLMITVFATIVLLMFMMDFSHAASVAAELTVPSGHGRQLMAPKAVLHSGVGLLLLLAATALSVYKPWGLTRYGRRKQQESQTHDSDSITRDAQSSLRIGIFLAVIAVIMLIVIVMHFIGSSQGHHGH